jgi:hypothetical protein
MQLCRGQISNSDTFDQAKVILPGKRNLSDLSPTSRHIHHWYRPDGMSDYQESDKLLCSRFDLMGTCTFAAYHPIGLYFLRSHKWFVQADREMRPFSTKSRDIHHV